MYDETSFRAHCLGSGTVVCDGAKLADLNRALEDAQAVADSARETARLDALAAAVLARAEAEALAAEEARLAAEEAAAADAAAAVAAEADFGPALNPVVVVALPGIQTVQYTPSELNNLAVVLTSKAVRDASATSARASRASWFSALTRTRHRVHRLIGRTACRDQFRHHPGRHRLTSADR